MRRKFLAATALAVLALGVGLGASALAATKTISEFGLLSQGRGWDFENFGIDDGLLVADGRTAEDAFDGGLRVSVDGTEFEDSNDKGDFSAKTNTFRAGPDDANGLDVSRTETAAGPYLRSLIKLSNTQGGAYDGTISWNSELGSDGQESAQATSSGDKTFTDSDRWLVSSETGANHASDDPVVAFAFSGKGANDSVDSVIAGPGSGSIFVDFENTKVPAHSARYLLFYTELWGTPAHAKKSMGKYNKRHLSKGLLKGIGKKTRKNILNWDL